jgi:hypothetical protein
MNPVDILNIIREDQCSLDRTVSDLKDQISRKTSSAEQPRDQEINPWGTPSAVKGKKGG